MKNDGLAGVNMPTEEEMLIDIALLNIYNRNLTAGHPIRPDDHQWLDKIEQIIKKYKPQLTKLHKEGKISNK